MRRTGLVDTVGGLGSHDHLCWVYETPADFTSAVGRFLSDGLAAGQRVAFMGDSVRESDLDRFDGFAAARATGAASAQDLGLYGTTGQVDPAAQIEAFTRAFERALADGFTGLRVAADVTPLVTTAEGRAAFGRYEHLIDAFLTRHPATGMCGFHRARVSHETITELAGMHPLAPPGSTPLRLFASAEPGVAAALAGEIDLAGYAQLRAALHHARPAAVDGTITLDTRELTFVDHRALIHIVEYVRGRGAHTTLLADPAGPVPPLADLLRMPDLRVVTA